MRRFKERIGIGWAWSLRPASWGIWVERGPSPWYSWRFNCGPFHLPFDAGMGA